MLHRVISIYFWNPLSISVIISIILLFIFLFFVRCLSRWERTCCSTRCLTPRCSSTSIPSSLWFQAPQAPDFQAPQALGFQAPQAPGFQSSPSPWFSTLQAPDFQVPQALCFKAPQAPGVRTPQTLTVPPAFVLFFIIIGYVPPFPGNFMISTIPHPSIFVYFYFLSYIQIW